jgi:hypothetical protein
LICQTIRLFDDLDDELDKRRGKPFYVPEKDELLKYWTESYFEISPQYILMLEYFTKRIFDGDSEKAKDLCEEIQDICQYGFSLNLIFNSIKEMGIVFDSEKQVTTVINLIVDLSNNVRLRENNGHTSMEISGLCGSSGLDREKRPRRVIKPGRNDPCPCGSGKKYKHCCLKKDEKAQRN